MEYNHIRCKVLGLVKVLVFMLTDLLTNDWQANLEIFKIFCAPLLSLLAV